MATKNALVVGASRGLGLGLTTRLLERGWRVTATSRHAGGDLEALATQWDGALTVETVDTNDAASVDALHKRLSDKVFDLTSSMRGSRMIGGRRSPTYRRRPSTASW